MANIYLLTYYVGSHVKNLLSSMRSVITEACVILFDDLNHSSSATTVCHYLRFSVVTFCNIYHSSFSKCLCAINHFVNIVVNVVVVALIHCKSIF